jgi:hypothetical protein
MSETDTVSGILIDPDQRKITQIRVPIAPVEEGPEINDIPLQTLYALLDCGEVGAFGMPGCPADSLFYNDEYLEAGAEQVGFFQLGEDWEPIAGRCLVVGFDMATHEYRDPVTTAEQLEARVIWSRRIVRAYQAEKTEYGIRIDRVAPIVEEP